VSTTVTTNDDNALKVFNIVKTDYEKKFDFNSYCLLKSVVSMLTQGDKQIGTDENNNESNYIEVSKLNAILVPYLTKQTQQTKIYNYLNFHKPVENYFFNINDPFDCRFVNLNMDSSMFYKDGYYKQTIPIIDQSPFLKNEVESYSNWLLQNNQNPPDPDQIFNYNKAIDLYSNYKEIGPNQSQLYQSNPTINDFVIKIYIKALPNTEYNIGFRNYFEVNDFNTVNQLKPIHFSTSSINNYKAHLFMSRFFSAMPTTKIPTIFSDTGENSIFSKIVKKIKKVGASVLDDVGLTTEQLISTAIQNIFN
jgi:hypothetical protein